MITEFSHDVKRYLNYYVYILIDPRNDEIFYVGKGSGNRVFVHENELGVQEKDQRISDILSEGLEVKKYIVHSGMTEEAALAAEATLINLYTTRKCFDEVNLTNVQIGHSVIAPCLSVEEYNRKFSGSSLTKDSFDEEDRIMLVNLSTDSIKLLATEEKVKERMKRRARVPENRELPKNILPVSRGVIVGAFKVVAWKRITNTGKSVRNQWEYTELVRNEELFKKYHFSLVSDLIKPYSNRAKYMLF